MIRSRDEMTIEQLGELLDMGTRRRDPAVDLALECLAALIVRAQGVETLYRETRDAGLWITAKKLGERLDAIADEILATSEAIEERTLFVEAGDEPLDQVVAEILARQKKPRPSPTAV